MIVFVLFLSEASQWLWLWTMYWHYHMSLCVFLQQVIFILLTQNIQCTPASASAISNNTSHYHRVSLDLNITWKYK